MSLDNFQSLTKEQQENLLNGPALAPPPGVIPNLENPPQHNTGAHALLAICLILTVFALSIRGYSRIFQSKSLQIPDYLAFIGFGCYVGYMYINYWLMNTSGFFVHQWDVRMRDAFTVSYIIHIGTNLYGIAVLGLKAAILIDWMGIFVPKGSRTPFWWASVLVLSLNTLWYLSNRIMENFHCIPFKRIWDLTVPGTCYDWTYGLLAASSINVISDFAIFILPQAIIWRLNMPRRRKIGLSIIFMLGLLGCVAATIRLAQTVKYVRSSDKVYTVSSMTLAAAAEMTCGFIVFGLPYSVKVFNGEMLLFKLVSSLSSLMGLVTKRQTGTNRDSRHRWSQTPPGAKPSDEYLILDDNGIPLAPRPTSKDTSTVVAQV
ncbi:hypothetical protein F4814DRAFT_413144 [Daldinia grandis]|nr:hypothetical protein F4814DRAFT_413144 [Daldinia grandis]